MFMDCLISDIAEYSWQIVQLPQEANKMDRPIVRYTNLSTIFPCIVDIVDNSKSDRLGFDPIQLMQYASKTVKSFMDRVLPKVQTICPSYFLLVYHADLLNVNWHIDMAFMDCGHEVHITPLTEPVTLWKGTIKNNDKGHGKNGRSVPFSDN